MTCLVLLYLSRHFEFKGSTIVIFPIQYAGTQEGGEKTKHKMKQNKIKT